MRGERQPCPQHLRPLAESSGARHQQEVTVRPGGLPASAGVPVTFGVPLPVGVLVAVGIRLSVGVPVSSGWFLPPLGVPLSPGGVRQAPHCGMRGRPVSQRPHSAPWDSSLPTPRLPRDEGTGAPTPSRAVVPPNPQSGRFPASPPLCRYQGSVLLNGKLQLLLL